MPPAWRPTTPRAVSLTPRPQAYEDALNDFSRAIELEPRSPTAYAYRAWTYRQQQQPELGLKDAERALKLDANSAEAHWARGEIYESLGRAEQAVADLRKALSLAPQLTDASDALKRLGASARIDEPEVANAGLAPWRVFRHGRQFVATNEEYPRLKVNLEMMGKGEPRILGWEIKEPPFSGIAVLRFSAGVVDGAKGPEVVEHAAIVDLQANSVVSVEVQRQGGKEAQWTWDDGKLIVASADGITDEFQLRQAKPKEPPPPPKRYADPWDKGWNSPSSSRRRKPKSFFDLIFKF